MLISSSQQARWKENKIIYIAMKKWEQLQLTLNNSKSEGGQDHYFHITQKLFKAMRSRVLEFEFVLVLFWRDQRKNSIYGMSSTRIYSSTFWVFEVSYRESNFFMRLQNFLLKFQQNSSKRFEEMIFFLFFVISFAMMKIEASSRKIWL